MEQEELRIYPLFVALTRKPMTWGVTQTFFVLNIMPCTILFLITKNILLALGLFGIFHVFGMICCWQDENFFEIILGKLELSCPNRRLWGCNSYDPN